MMHNKRPFIGVIGVATVLVIGAGAAAADPLLIVGNDEKVRFDEKGSPALSLPGKDSILILDLADPEAPKIIANLPLKNSIAGPPVNLAIDPTNSIALVADSVDVKQEGDKLIQSPDNKLYVIDLKAKPPKLVDTLMLGKQPSGLSFNPAGNLALVATRVDKSIAVLSVMRVAWRVRSSSV